jgi:hypothetical protein
METTMADFKAAKTFKQGMTYRHKRRGLCVHTAECVELEKTTTCVFMDLGQGDAIGDEVVALSRHLICEVDLVPWRSVGILEDDAETEVTDAATKLLKMHEFRTTGSIHGYFLEPTTKGQKLWAYADEWGPDVREIDWAGLDEALGEAALEGGELTDQ